MSEIPRVSVIIPNYNHAQFLHQRIETVLSQTYQNFELILLDDCSTDDSVAILESYKSHPRVSITDFNTVNSGSPFKQWQKGISQARGEYIWIAESDDYAEPEFLESLLALADQSASTKLDVIYSQSFDADEEGTVFSSRYEYTEDISTEVWSKDFVLSGNEFITRYLKVKNVIPNASAVVFSTAKARTIDFTEALDKMRTSGDRLFWIKMLEEGRVGFVAKELNYFRFHSAVTRVHNSYDKVFRRCLEERSIRVYLRDKFQCEQKNELIVLYDRWFAVNSFLSIFSKQFYSIKLDETSLFSYTLQFMKGLVVNK